MKTVGDFKWAGLVFVEGDLCKDCNDGDVYGREGDESEWVKRVNNGLTLFNSDTITEFAWRTNTGVKPEFVGIIDFIHRDGDEFNCHHINKSSSCEEWDLDDHSGDIIKWRPHLPAVIQTETPEEKEAFEAMNKSPYDVDAHVSDASKPVYTQAMCDAGELPPVGSEFRVHKTNYFMVGVSSFGSVVGEHPDFAEYKGFHARDCKPIKTELEKAIDEMVATAVNSADDIAKSIIYEACVKLAEAGYVKPCSNNK